MTMKNRLFEIENWREIMVVLSRNKTRTFLTAFGIFWGTAMLAILLGAASGATGLISRKFEGFATNSGALVPLARQMSYKGFNEGSDWNLTQYDIDLIRQSCPAIEFSSGVDNINTSVKAGKESMMANINGIEPDFLKIVTPYIVEGRFLNEADVSAARKVCLIGKNVASRLFPTASAVGQQVTIGDANFIVVGVVGQDSQVSINGRVDDGVIMPITTYSSVFNKGDHRSFFAYTSRPGTKVSDSKAQIYRIIKSRHNINPQDDGAIWFMDFAEQFEKVNMVFFGLAILAFFIGFSSLMSGVIGVGNIMWIIVKERTHEFGIRRAIGAKPRDITVQVLSESIVLTLVSGVLGVCFAAGVLQLLDKFTAEPNYAPAGFQISFGLAVAIVAAFFVLGSAAGTLPAVKAMKIKPIEALRTKS